MTDIRLEISEMDFALVIAEHTAMLDAWNQVGELLTVASTYGDLGNMPPEMQGLFAEAIQEQFDNIKTLFDRLGDEDEQARLMAHLKGDLDGSE